MGCFSVVKVRIAIIMMILFFVLLAGCAGKAERPRILWPPPPSVSKLEWIGVYSSERDFPKTDSEKRFQALLGDNSLYQFITPFGIAADGNGRVFISDIHLKNVRIFDFETRTVQNLTSNSFFQLPLGMDMDRDERLYVADGTRKIILVFDNNLNMVDSLGNAGFWEKPAFIAVNENLGRIYVTDGLGCKIVVLNMKGEHLFSFGNRGSGEGEFNAPQGLAFNNKNELFVADMLNARIQVFDAEGNYLRGFGKRGDRVWQMENPKDLAFDGMGNMYLTDSRRGSFRIFDSLGTLLLDTGSTGRTAHPLGFSNPASIYVDKNDRIYIVDMLNKRFAIWQYLSEEYLEKRPVTEEDIEQIYEFRRREK